MKKLGVCNGDKKESQVCMDGTGVWEGDRYASQVCRGGQVCRLPNTSPTQPMAEEDLSPNLHHAY